MTHPTRAFSGSIINRFTGSKILYQRGSNYCGFSSKYPLDKRGYSPLYIVVDYQTEDNILAQK